MNFKEIEERVEAATPPYLTAENAPSWRRGMMPGFHYCVFSGTAGTLLFRGEETEQGGADCDFIAHARQDILDLLKLVRRMVPYVKSAARHECGARQGSPDGEYTCGGDCHTCQARALLAEIEREANASQGDDRETIRG